MTTPDGLRAELDAMDFAPVQRDRHGALQFARKPSRYLTEWVHDNGDELLFTWEFDLGEFCQDMGWQIGAAETSFQILYPQFDARLARDGSAVAAEIRRLEQRLSAINLLDPTG